MGPSKVMPLKPVPNAYQPRRNNLASTNRNSPDSASKGATGEERTTQPARFCPGPR